MKVAWRSHRKGLAIVGLFLFLMGVVVPAAFGLLTEKAMGLGVGDLLDKSTNWDESNIANSTYFVSEYAKFLDNETGTKYSLDLVYDDSKDLDLVMNDKSTVDSSASVPSDLAYFVYKFNTTALDDVDKVIVLAKIEDTGELSSLQDAEIRVTLECSDDGASWTLLDYAEINATEAYNSTARVEFTLDAVKRLKLSSAQYVRLMVYLQAVDGKVVDLDNAVWGAKVELYDVKKVNATAASNIMLAVSGVLGWLGALAATPYWNPYANREHRNIRRVGRAVKRRIPRRRR